MPLGVGSWGFLELQTNKSDMAGQHQHDPVFKINEHIFTGRLVIGKDNLFKIAVEFRNVAVRRIPIQQKCMIEPVNNLIFDNFFEVRKIHYHPVFGIGRVVERRTTNGNFQFIGVPMNIFTWPIIPVKGMSHFKIEYLCEAYHISGCKNRQKWHHIKIACVQWLALWCF